MEPIDIVRKLLRLATNNPNEEEATAAALKAVRMLVEHEIPIGGVVTESRPRAPLTPEEKVEFTDIISALSKRGDPDEFRPASYYATTEIDDEAMKKRIIQAWRQIREVRKNLRSEIDRYERETHRPFTDTGWRKW